MKIERRRDEVKNNEEKKICGRKRSYRKKGRNLEENYEKIEEK